MAFRYSIGIVLVLFLSHARGDPIPSDAQTCIDLCSSCKGIASFEDDRCECDIEDNSDDGAECLSRMKREAQERGIDFLSCDSSEDTRSTRCILGLKKKLLAKSRLFGKNCAGASNVIVQPPETLRSSSCDCLDNRQFISSSIDASVGTPEHVVSHPLSLHIPSKHLLGSAPVVSKPVVGLNLMAHPHHQHHQHHQHHHLSLGANAPSHHAIGSSLPHNYPVPSSHGLNYNGAGQIITHPKETVDTKSFSLHTPIITDNCGQAVEQSIHGSSGHAVGSCKPLNLVGIHNLAPAFLQFLGHLSHPTLGIPGVIRTISESPSINSLVSAPGNLLNSIAESLGGGGNLLVDKSLQIDSADDISEIGSTSDCVNEEEDQISSNLGVQNAALNIPSVNSPLVSVINPSIGMPQSAQIAYVNPAVSAPASAAQVSYIHSVPAYTTIPMIQNPIMNNLVPQLPASAYMVGSPFGLSYMNNYNSISPSLISSTSTGTRLIGKSRSHGVSSLKSQKKICKKSAKEDTAKKTTRDVKADSKSTDKEMMSLQSEGELNSISAQAKKYSEQMTEEIPKIDRTTTQQTPSGSRIVEKFKVDKSVVDRTKVDKVKVEKGNVGKMKPAKEFIKKPKIDKKSTEPKSDVNS